MRVAFYAPLKPPTDPTPSGDRRIARLLIRAIRRAGHEPVLASRFRAYDGTGDSALQARLKARGARTADRLVDRLSGARRPALWFTYHLYYKAPDWLGPAVSRRLGIPYLVAEASHAPKRAGGPWATGHAQVEAALHAAAHVLFLNEEDRQCVQPLLAKPGKDSLLPPFLDTGPYRRAQARREETRAMLTGRHGVPDDVPWLLAVGMMRQGDKLASYRVLAEALTLIADRPWRLLIAGGGGAEPEVRRLFASLGDRVAFLGMLNERALTPVYAACDLLVWPAVGEAIGMAILEAQAAGLPAVAGRAGAVPEIVEDGATARLSDANPADFAAALGTLLDDPARLASMGARAAERARTRHDLEQAAGRIDKLFRTLVPGAP